MTLTDLIKAIPANGKTAGLKTAQLQEVVRATLTKLASASVVEVAKLLAQYRNTA